MQSIVTAPKSTGQADDSVGPAKDSLTNENRQNSTSDQGNLEEFHVRVILHGMLEFVELLCGLFEHGFRLSEETGRLKWQKHVLDTLILAAPKVMPRAV